MGYSLPKPITVFASAARTASATSETYKIPGGIGNGQYRGLLVVIDATALAATPSVVFNVQTSSGPADAMATLLASAAITAAGVTKLVIHPSVTTEVANSTDQGPLESTWCVVATAADADSLTYSVTVFPLP